MTTLRQNWNATNSFIRPNTKLAILKAFSLPNYIIHQRNINWLYVFLADFLASQERIDYFKKVLALKNEKVLFSFILKATA